MTDKKTAFTPGALALTEEAVHLLRRRGGTALVEYYVGSLPFLLGLLYFWSDMSRNPDAGWYCTPAAGAMALLFIWMKYWQVRFCRQLWCALQDTAPETWSWRRSLTVTVRQTALQATGMAVLPLAALIALPMGWVYAFYQNLSVLDGPDTKDAKTLYKDAAAQAALWPGSNHLMLTILTLFALFVLLNAAVGVMTVPYLLKWLLGIETAFTISGAHAMLNTTFLAIVCALTYLCVDPLIKAAYTLRCFYGRSRVTGDDLRAGLKPFLTAGLVLIMVWGGVAWGAVASTAAARENNAVEARAGQTIAAGGDYPQQLDQAIEQVLKQRRFAWRLPREKSRQAPEEEQGWWARSLRWLAAKIDAAFAAIDKWLEELVEWLRRHLPEGEVRDRGGRDFRPLIRITFYLVGAALAALLLMLARRWLRSKRAARPKTEAPAAMPVIDLNDETIAADDLPRDRWLAMAQELMARQNFRHAMRALYLAVLALLGDRGRLGIARYKSNRDYLGELARRAHAEPELFNLFDRCMRAFECAWYGNHPVGREQLSQFISDQERIASIVQQPA